MTKKIYRKIHRNTASNIWVGYTMLNILSNLNHWIYVRKFVKWNKMDGKHFFVSKTYFYLMWDVGCTVGCWKCLYPSKAHFDDSLACFLCVQCSLKYIWHITLKKIIRGCLTMKLIQSSIYKNTNTVTWSNSNRNQKEQFTSHSNS